MIINEKYRSTITTYLEKHMVYCPGCNKRFRSDNRPVSIAELTTSQTDYVFMLDKACSPAVYSGSNARRDIFTREIEKRILKQPDIYCPQELMAILQSCTQNEDGKPEMVVELGDPPWKTADRAWFLDHPGRTHRLRKRFPEEDGSPADWIIIRCLKPGERLRLVVQAIKADKATLLMDNDDGRTSEWSSVMHIWHRNICQDMQTGYASSGRL
jgi:hypothetical protein